MASRPTFKTEQFDMDSFFDFNQGTTQSSPVTASSSRMTDEWNTLDDRRQFNGPSHDYHQYKQQVGLPVGSTVNMPQHAMFDGGYNSGPGFDSTMSGWSSGIDMDADMAMDFNQPPAAMLPLSFPPADTTDTFVNPNTIQEEPTSNVGRLWPGMHSQQAQQAAMQKAANTQAMQQRQMKLQAQHAQYRQLNTTSTNPPAPQQTQASSQPSQASSSKRTSHASEPHVEESISRLLHQMRHNTAAGDADDDSQDNYPNMARMKKDEEEMDEDERLLASDEGKKLSSKERRQLRNKVSARAFRSRRKEYIGQLEGEVAIKVQEANNLRGENSALMQENDRYRGLIETLLRHPAFTPFINDISKDPSVLGTSQAPRQMQVQQAPPASTTSQPLPQPQQQQQQDAKPDFANFDVAQIQVPQQQNDQQINLATIPESDFSKLNLHGFQQAMNFNHFQSVDAFAVTELPPGPNPANLLIESSAYLSPSSAISNHSIALPSDMELLLANLDGAARKLGFAAI